MNNVKYKKYSSSNGIITGEWGPSAWHFLFCSIMGSYPYKINKNDKEHNRISKTFKCMFSSLKYTLPCCVCTESYNRFWKELPIDDYLGGRISLMYWLYLIKDRVNNKLMFQENERFKAEKKRIDTKYKTEDINIKDYKIIIKKLKARICVTKKSISFNKVLEFYESLRYSK